MSTGVSGHGTIKANMIKLERLARSGAKSTMKKPRLVVPLTQKLGYCIPKATAQAIIPVESAFRRQLKHLNCQRHPRYFVTSNADPGPGRSSLGLLTAREQ